jgi:hypothetical protein
MRKGRFSEEHGVLREQESTATTAAVCRRHGISEQTFGGRRSTAGWVHRTRSA